MVYFTSDVHLGGGGPEVARRVERQFVAWLDAVSADAEAVVLLGDIFDFWFEYREVVPRGFVRTLGRLAAMTDRGIRVLFFTGNHDQWMRDYLARECGVEVYTAPRVVTLCGQRLFLAHGDNMNIGERPALRLLNAVFRSRLLRWLFSWGVHPDWAMRFGHAWSAHSRRKHIRQGPPPVSLTDPLVEYARRYAARNRDAVDHFVFGHMHVARDYREGSLHTVHLGCWERGPVYARLDEADNLRLEHFTPDL